MAGGIPGPAAGRVRCGLNPIARLAANPVTRAFLGQPVGVHNNRAAMDAKIIVWVRPGRNGPPTVS
ncbi:hypothetical protein [Streptomyces osmaniensis]|uniref:hypothetical protein n=1 Tax=Streptomyces osmaniensis TaxID=593134 RepID=UPI003D159624